MVGEDLEEGSSRIIFEESLDKFIKPLPPKAKDREAFPFWLTGKVNDGWTPYAVVSYAENWLFVTVLKRSISKLKLLFKNFGSPKFILYVLVFADVSKEKYKFWPRPKRFLWATYTFAPNPLDWA